MKNILLSTLIVAGLLLPAASRAMDDSCAAEGADKFTPGCKAQLQSGAKAIKAELKKIGTLDRATQFAREIPSSSQQ